MVGAQSSDLDAQVDGRAADRPRRRRHPDRRQRRHPRGAARRPRCATSPQPCAACARPTSRSSSAPVPTSAPSSRFQPPLRQVARVWSRRLAAAQTIAVVEAGGRTVSLGSILGPEFAAAPALLFGPDRFHPSAAGYEALARTMVPSVLAALGLGEDEEERAARRTRRGRAADRVRRGQGQPEPRHRDRRHRGRRRQPRRRRPLGDPDAPPAAAHRAPRRPPTTHEDAPADSAEAPA